MGRDWVGYSFCKSISANNVAGREKNVEKVLLHSSNQVGGWSVDSGASMTLPWRPEFMDFGWIIEIYLTSLRAPRE